MGNYDQSGFYEEPVVPQARPGFPGWKDLGEVEVSHAGSQQIQKFGLCL